MMTQSQVSLTIKLKLVETSINGSTTFQLTTRLLHTKVDSKAAISFWWYQRTQLLAILHQVEHVVA